MLDGTKTKYYGGDLSRLAGKTQAQINSKSTSETLTGEYTVEADDCEGHKDTTTANIVMPVRAVASPTPAPTTTPMPTTSQQTLPAPASTPTTQPENSSTSTSSTLPWLEAIFVITALLVVYLFVFMLRRKRK